VIAPVLPVGLRVDVVTISATPYVIRHARPWLILAASLVAGCGEPEQLPAAHPMDATLRMDQLQALGTHNSYHLEPEGNALIDWGFSHLPLPQQLGEQGVRKLELDVYYDSERGGFHVMHIGLVDDRTTCATLQLCLEQLRAWSDDHRGHHPIFVMIEPKTAFSETSAERILSDLDRIVAEVMKGGRIITPAEVRGDAATLRQAIVGKGWPTLDVGRGRFVFWMDNWGEWASLYSHRHTTLDHRQLFVVSALDQPVAAITNINDPISSAAAIREAVAQGFIVRTRADGVELAHAGDDSKLKAALASGAQLISSDLPAPVSGVPYHASIPGGTPSRCNPISAPSDCVATAIEDPARLKGR
jgi:hypothetical protein